MKTANYLTVILIFSFFLFVGTGCKKYYFLPDDNTLPAETQIGAGTFACIVDGKVWVSKSYNFTSSKHLNFSFDHLNVGAYKGIENIDIDVSNIKGVGSYNLIPFNNTAIYVITDLDYTIKPVKYDCVSGNLEITKIGIDINNRFVSGRFSFIAEDTSTNRTISVTNGRFDLHYY